MLAQKAKRPLTLPEELEKIEQQITLTLQEIDHNFSKAHQIVTSTILPVVERFGSESKTVWEGSKFWKHFFEASANVCLSNYEEPTTKFTEEQQNTAGHGNDNTRQEGDGIVGEEDEEDEEDEECYEDDDDDVTVTGAGGGSTRVDQSQGGPDEGTEDHDEDPADVSTDSLLASLNFEPCTPPKASKGRAKWVDVDTPYVQTAKQLRRAQPSQAVSTKKQTVSAMKQSMSTRKTRRGSGAGIADEDDDDDELMLSLGFSPPVTIQFSIPQRQILATPARVASKQLVRDILRTAGANESASTDASNVGSMAAEAEDHDDDDAYALELDDYGNSGQQMKEWRKTGTSASSRSGRDMFGEEVSPTIVRGRGMGLWDETF